MDVNKLSCKEFIKGTKKRFEIPIYQRHYNWHTRHCKQLYNDLINIAKSAQADPQADPSITHFFGNIFALRKQEGVETNIYILIDGQKRITSIFLLYLAMYNIIKSHKAIIKDKSTETDLIDEIYNEILVERNHPEIIHLLLGENDREDFNHLFNLAEGKENNYIYNNPNIYNNYEYFYNQLLQLDTTGVSLPKLSEAVARLRMVIILLEEHEKPQQIFESLNSTGLALSECDKIRNFLFMDRKVEDQKHLYSYWKQIETNVGNDIDNLNEFFRHYLSIVLQRQPKIDEIYIDYKEYASNDKNTSEDQLIEITNYAKLYKRLKDYEKVPCNNQSIHGSVYRLGRLQITTPRPLMLKLFRLQQDNKLLEHEVASFLTIIENYIFRRFVCSLPTNSLKSVFLSLLKELSGDSIDLEKLKYRLINKNSDDKSRFPNDDEFKKAFMNIDFYLLDLKNVQYALERINNFGTGENHPVWEGFDRDTQPYSVEHIMPQTLNGEWKKDLGDNWKTIHMQWLHRIANLTITAYNQEYKNRAFREKRDCEHGFDDSGLRINHWISKRKQWGLAQLEERSKKLGEKALEIWPMPKSTYKPIIKPLEAYTLAIENANCLVGREIQSFSYKEETHNVATWASMYVAVLKILHEQDKSVLMDLVNSNDEQGENMYGVSYYRDGARVIDESEQIYVSTNTSTPKKIELLLKFFELYNADPSDLVFYLRDKQNNEI